ncbi:MAG: SRPBCC domain-containing protein [Phenylobacterium sp.]|uniref:SRPBCC family protein n=1 Tax=Phenylobacterium sp. TaxID=1871053 RepID=UPI0017FD9DED|nr:SRPBCC domain-containing protein [Phenylobacterium sp.]MBA4792867.1 SRPBCC domain-containing protein [Phenylobacterium sp.]
MTDPEPKSVVVERDLAHPPERVWRALTQPHLLAEWLMRTDFEPRTGHSFSFTAEWGAVECKVMEIEPERRLAYSWGDGVLDTVVTWTLTPTKTGAHLRMEQTGFRRDQPRYLMGATAGWPRFFDNLEQVLARETAQ